MKKTIVSFALAAFCLATFTFTGCTKKETEGVRSGAGGGSQGVKWNNKVNGIDGPAPTN